MIAALIFYLFSGVVIVSACAVVLARNPVHSVLWLVLAFFNAAGLFVLLGAEFLAMLLVIVYVGAVAVLFLFVVMMLDIDFAELRAGFAKYLPFGLLLGAVFLGELILVVSGWQFAGWSPTVHAAPMAAGEGLSNTAALGAVLYTRYAFVVSSAGMVLLTALIGAIVLTHRQRPGVRRQNIGVQVSRTPANAVHLVDVKSGEGVDVG